MNNLLIIGVGLLIAYYYLKKHHVDIFEPVFDYTTVAYEPEAEIRDAEIIFSRYAELVKATASKRGIEPAVALAIIHSESTGQEGVITQGANDQCYGLMQICLKTAQESGYKGEATGLLNPVLNIEYGIFNLILQLNRNSGNYLDAIAAYNLGSVRRRSAGGYINQGYVNKVVRLTNIYRKFFIKADQRYMTYYNIAREIPIDKTDLI